MSPISGFVRLRKHQFGRQAAFGTNVPATKAYPFSGTPSVVLNWTDPEVDVGSRDRVAPPYRVGGDFTANLSDGALNYNSIPIIMAGFFGGGETPTGGGDAKTWTHMPASLTVDELDPFTYEFGDDRLDDWFQLGDGVLDSLELSGPDGLGPISTSMSWRFGSAKSTGSTDSPVDGTVPTPDLNVDPNAALVYLKDMGIYISDTVGGLGAGQVTNALHNFTLRLTQEIDLKRFANGDQTFDIAAYGPGTRGIELVCTFAKTDDTVGTGSESDAWMSDQSVTRYVSLRFLSTVLAQTPSTYYAWDLTMPLRYYTRDEGEIGGNSTVGLTGHAFYDPDSFAGVFSSVAVTTLTEADLGLVGS